MMSGFLDRHGKVPAIGAITMLGPEAPSDHPKPGSREAHFDDAPPMFLSRHDVRKLLERPGQLIPSEPGCRLIRVVEGEAWSEPLIAWALCLDGEVRPVTPNGVCGGSSGDHHWVAMPDGSVQAVGEYTEPMSFDSIADMVRYFTPPTEPTEEDPWPAAEEALRAITADVRAYPGEGPEFDVLASRQMDAILAITALPARTAAQALRKLELATEDGSIGVDLPKLRAEARRLVGMLDDR